MHALCLDRNKENHKQSFEAAITFSMTLLLAVHFQFSADQFCLLHISNVGKVEEVMAGVSKRHTALFMR